MRDAKKGARDKPDYTRVVEFVLPTEKADAISAIEIQNRTGLTHKQVVDAISQLADRGAKIRRTSGLLGIKKYYKVGAVSYADNILHEDIKRKQGIDTGITYRKENETMKEYSDGRSNGSKMEYADAKGSVPKWVRAVKEFEKRSVIYCKDCGKKTNHIYGEGDTFTPLCTRCHQKREIRRFIDKTLR